MGIWCGAFASAIAMVVFSIIDFTHSGRGPFQWHIGGLLILLAGLVAVPRFQAVRRFILRVLMLLVPAFLTIVVYANATAVWASRGRLFDNPDQLPKIRTALVFGTSSRFQGRENHYFRYRMDAVAEVWDAGKIDIIIVSGDNRTHYYNEPREMRQALVERGIPNERIVSDFAGLRTLDSVVRAKEIFGADPVLFISQRFQNERAIYLAKANGIDAYGYNARDVGTQAGLKTRIREVGARVKMWLDVRFLNTRPRHLGEPIELPDTP